jgi:nucleotide-binding universal stress UspA family protein
MTPKRFLIPHDFSPYADRALTYAIDLGKALHAHLTLLHIIQSLPLAVGIGDASAALADTYLQDLESEANRRLNEAYRRVQQAGLQGDAMVLHGVPFQTIIEVAADKHTDLIVMGTHGRTGLTHIFLGSVAEKVVRLASCPVLVVRDQAVTQAT